MPIPTEQARALLVGLRDVGVENLFAQVRAQNVLYEVGETPENFPAFDSALADKVTFASYGMLAAGCSLIELGNHEEGVRAVERSASILQYSHGPLATASRDSGFHVLVAAMAFYAAGQYSRAFVAIRSVEQQTAAGSIIAAFLRKDVAALIPRLNELLLRGTPEGLDQVQLDDLAITTAIGRAIAIALEFIFTGRPDSLVLADDQLRNAGRIASAGDHPAWWWVVRLLRLMLSDLGEASPWRILPPDFPTDSADALGRYVRVLAFAPYPIAELWSSQRAALPLALTASNRGAVINLRTSAGKTRVAELAILQTLLADASSRVFYLAPFRSLALEVEHSLASTFSWLGHRVSHLYGGSRVSSVDTELAAESAITIATPEKARALLRAAPELFENVKLIIIDEGHLVGASERFVRNEVFVDHLRSLVRTTGARVLLLSAVLPNAEQLAEWVVGDPNAVARSPWKPSAERFGLLRWNGSRVRIDWQGDFESFNPSFVEAKPLGFGKRHKPFPASKIEAVAAAAVRLSAIGPVMIFSGRASSVPTLAVATLLALGEQPPVHRWPEHEWRVFEATCGEELDQDAIELQAARAGVVCHSNRLTPQVRLALEHLMRSSPPRIIIATTTLAQGVNVGISSVIIATPYTGEQTIDKRDFWNICGRAGRAFVDGEGKVLYAIDDTRKRWQVQKDESLARSYFDTATNDPVESGLLFLVNLLRRVAETAAVPFDVLLELAANNDFSRLGGKSSWAESLCDLIDDELLALYVDPLANPASSDPETWVDGAFRDSLAVIQARAGTPGASADDVIGFMRARTASALSRVAPESRKAVVSSGLPLIAALRVHNSLDTFRQIADTFIAADGLPGLAAAVQDLEGWARVNAPSVFDKLWEPAQLDAVRLGWLSGVGLRTLGSVESGAKDITRSFYGYELAWVIHAASQQLRVKADRARREALATIALSVELGVPSALAARIFLAGVRSRVAATELARLDTEFGSTVADIGRNLRDSVFSDQLRPLVSSGTANWLDLMIVDGVRSRTPPLPAFPEFAVDGTGEASVLHARRLGDQIFLCTVDGRTKVAVTASADLPLGVVANDPRVAFTRSDDNWHLTVRDPRLESRDVG